MCGTTGELLAFGGVKGRLGACGGGVGAASRWCDVAVGGVSHEQRFPQSVVFILCCGSLVFGGPLWLFSFCLLCRGVPCVAVLLGTPQKNCRLLPTFRYRLTLYFQQHERAFQKQPTIFLADKRLRSKKSKGTPRFYKNVGLGFKTPKEAIEGTYIDKKCPFTGNVAIRGRILRGVVTSTKMNRTIIIRRDYLRYVTKYNRYEKRHHNIAAHMSPAFVGVKPGDVATVGQCRYAVSLVFPFAQRSSEYPLTLGQPSVQDRALQRAELRAPEHPGSAEEEAVPHLLSALGCERLYGY